MNPQPDTGIPSIMGDAYIIPASADTFSHRITPTRSHDEVLNIQSNLLVEALIRKNIGNVHNWGLVFEKTSKDGVPDVYTVFEEDLKNILKLSNFHIIYQRYHSKITAITLFSDDSVVTLYPNYLHQTKLNTVSMNLVSTIATLEENPIIKCFFKSGFILSDVFKEEEIEDMVGVHFAIQTGDNVLYPYREFASVPLDKISMNYTPKVVIETRQLLDDIKVSTNGLIILHGPVGTGKSYLIRSLLSELKQDGYNGVVCAPPLPFLRNFALLVNVLGEIGKPLIIFEDIGEVLAADSPFHDPDGVSNLINITDGLLSLLSDALLVVTFNHDIARINPAVTRNGRCLAQIEITNIPQTQAMELTNRQFDLKDENYSLADIYEMKRREQPIKSKKISALPGR